MKKEKKIKLVCLDLGCGENKSTKESLMGHGLVREDDGVDIKGVDNHKCKGVDIKHDLTKFPYPFKENSIDIVISSHFLEHLDGEQRIKFFNEMYRIMKKGAKMRHIHPYYRSSRAVQDPTHKFPPICENSYLYWNKSWREMNKIGHYLGTCDFEVTGMHYTFMDNSWTQKNEETRNFAIRHYTEIVADMIVDLIRK
jgi:predicted SAM-dependent methyltransferase